VRDPELHKDKVGRVVYPETMVGFYNAIVSKGLPQDDANAVTVACYVAGPFVQTIGNGRQDMLNEADRVLRDFADMESMGVEHMGEDIIQQVQNLNADRALQPYAKTNFVELLNAISSGANCGTGDLYRPLPGGGGSYAKIVEKKAILRRLIDGASQIVANAYDEKNEVDEVLDQAEQKIFAVSQKHVRNDFTSVKPILEEAFDRIDELSKNKGKLRGVPTGFRDLDQLLSGLQESNLIILGARPSMGKSSFVMDIARQAAVSGRVPVGIFSLEMSKGELIDRLICAQAKVDLWKMRTGNLSSSGENDDFSRIGHAIGILSEAPIFIDDTSGLNVMEIRTMSRRLQAEHGLGLIIIDYLQLIEGRAGIDNRVQVIGEISRNLKGLARELHVPIIALSQLSRGVESRDDQKPKLSDLRESGSIEQDADVVMFIYREDRAKRSDTKTGIADIIVAKHRNGPIGDIQLYFKQEYTSFVDIDKNHIPNG
jgi:replicative DNA helicase